MGLLNIFRKKENNVQNGAGVYLTAQLNARIQPVDRGDQFEDPLHDKLQTAGLGEVTGGGTQLAEDPDGIAYCDVEFLINDPTEENLAQIVAFLEELGAPRGSILKGVPGKADIEFGTSEGLALFLNGTDLPSEVYQNADVNETISNCNALMEGIGMMLGHWQGNKETALYFYGSSFQKMEIAIAEHILKDPLCEKSRIVQIA